MSLKVAQVNVRSLIKNFLPFHAHLSVSTYHIVGVTETWLHADHSEDIINIENYSYVRQDRPHTVRGGGVGFYIDNRLSFKIIMNEYREYIEQLWIEVKHQNKVHAVGVVYRTSSSRDYPSFFSSFEETLLQMHLKYDSIICLGDFNLDMLKIQDTNASYLIQLADTFNLKQIVNEPTRISKTCLSILDLIFTNRFYNTDSGTIELNIADHRFVYSNIQVGVTMADTHKQFTYRDFTGMNDGAFLRDLRSISWNIMYDFCEVDDKILFLNKSILKIFETHCPLRSVSARKHYAPWITPVIKIMQKQRDNALKRFRQTKLPTHWDYYKQIRNHTNQAISSEKKAYLRQKFQNIDNKQKWQELRKLNIIRNRKNTVPSHLAEDVNSINSFFVNNDIDGPDRELLDFYRHAPCLTEFPFTFKQVTEEFISKIILNIKSNAIGHDQLNKHLLHICCPFLIPHITHIVNQCIKNSTFPKVWKKAIITPLPKVSNPTEFAHLRSISILPTLSKVLEKVMESQIRDYLNDNDIIPSMQSGFRSGYSCETALCNITDDIFKACDDSKITVLITLDYSKAFDMINHDILIGILRYMGFEGAAVRLVKSFLTDRSQVVICGDNVSDELYVTKGVPQGSILGPLLFVVYTSFFHKCLKACSYHLYADDTQLYCSFSPFEKDNFCKKINQDLADLYNVVKKHNLKVNPTKSTVTIIGNKQYRAMISDTCQFFMGGELIPYKDSVKSLGLMIDSDLRFSIHVSNMLRKAYASLKMMYPHRRCLSRDVKILLCDSLVLSHFNYCDNVYGPCLDAADVGRIQKVQNSCLRFIYGIRRPNRISYKLQEAQWLSMHNRRELHFACFCHRLLLIKTPPYLHRRLQFRTDVHNINIRKKDLLTIPKHRKQVFKRSFSYMAAHLINKVDKVMKGRKCRGLLASSKILVRETFKQHLFGLQ